MGFKKEEDNPGRINEVIIGVLILIITGLVLYMLSSSIFKVDLSGAIATLLGAFLGASIAGFMAIKIAREQNELSLQIARDQNNFIRENQRNLENSKTLKTIIQILSFTTIYYEKMITINEILTSESRFSDEELLEKIDYLFNDINEQFLSFFNQIDWSTIDIEDFSSVSVMREIGNSIIEDYYIYKEVEKVRPAEMAARWNSKLVELKELMGNLKSKYKDQLT